jgi:hypothetical protein
MKKYFALLLLIFISSFLNVHADDSMVSILYADDEFIEVKGAYYNCNRLDLPFAIETRQLFKMSNEKRNDIGNNSYYLTMTLTSLINNESHDFQSLIMMDDDHVYSSITKIKNTSSYIVQGVYSVTTKKYFGEYETTHHPCWDAYVECEIELDDQTIYLMILRIREYSLADANARLENFPVIQIGDQISFGKESIPQDQGVLDLKNCLYDFSTIYRDNQKIQINQVKFKGNKRRLKTYSIWNIQDRIFKLRNYPYYFDSKKIDFYLDYDENYVLASEEIEYLADHSYRLTIGLVSPTTNKIHYFPSLVLNDEDYAEIGKIQNYKRFLSWIGSDSYPIWVVRHEFEMILKDGSSYKVRGLIEKSNKKEAEGSVNDVLIQEGDQIFWGPEVTYEWQPIEAKNVNFEYARFYQGGKQVTFNWLQVRGHLRRTQSTHVRSLGI